MQSRIENHHQRWVRPVLAAVAAASLLAIAGCSAAGNTDDQASSGADLEQFMNQSLDFGECDASIVDLQPPVPEIIESAEAAECATLEVPLDYEQPEGKTIDIAVSRVAATGDDRIGSVVVNPGGPGIQATTFAPLLAALWKGGPVAERFDIVGFDPRGVGLSSPAVDCYTDEERDDEPPVSGLAGWTAESAREMVERCAAGSGGEDFLAHLGTRDVARDLDVLRSALGDNQLSFAGVSYGTRLGAVYAEMFPENVRALVLDGAIDPLKNTRERRLQLNVGLQRSFEQLAAFCATQADCPLGNDPAQATEVAQQLLQPLTGNPAPTSDGRGLSFASAGEGVIAGLYSEASWPAVIAGLTELRSGTGDGLLALRDSYYGRSASGDYSNDVEASFAINCMDEEFLTTEQTTDLLQDLNEAAPFMHPGAELESHYGCEAWPAEPTLDFPYATDIEELPEVLVTSVTGDGLTPHDAGINLAETLGARLLTVDGEQHGAISSRNECIDGVVADYLVNLELPAEGARCSL